MLEVQKYLLQEGKSFETLTEEFGIKVVTKDHLVKMSYCQINSPKTHPITMESRGLVLNKFTLGVVGSCFKRFFNQGEAENITGNFDWSDFSAWTKEDGSWISLFYDNFTAEWRVTTRGSFADSAIYDGGPVWSDLVFELLDGRQDMLPTHCTYIWELCTMHNKVVREYKTPKLILLGVIDNTTQCEVDDKLIDLTASELMFDRPQNFNFDSLSSVVDWIANTSKIDATFEGLVLKDKNGLRVKCKSETYLALHHLKGEGKNMFMPKYILPFVLNGEGSELLAYFPEVEPRYNEVNDMVNVHLNTLLAVWEDVKGIEDQKTFALAISKRTPFSCFLFQAKKDGGNVETKFRNNPEMILKVLKMDKEN